MNASAGKRREPLVLVGFMACGKSTIGRLLARQLNLPFADSDEVIEEALGVAIAEIFRTKGEAYFRDIERDTIHGLLGEERLIAAGGGAFVDPATRGMIENSALTIWLDPPFEIIRRRLSRSLGRPIAATRTDDELHELWLARRPSYGHADIHLEISTHAAEDVATMIVDRLPAIYSKL